VPVDEDSAQPGPRPPADPHPPAEEVHRQADQLRVLNDLARRLASLRDPAEVLHEVAAQARRLLGVDVAYIMLLGEGGLLRIEVVDGTMGSGMRGIELAPGSGLGGLVVSTGRPVWSRSYLEDTRFPHAERVDAAASGEHLAGILGVPLLVGDEHIGVLLVAERRPRDFSAGEVELLAALAAHAAVAIRNAQLFDGYSRAEDALRRTNAELERTNRARQQAADLRDDLTRTVIAGGDVALVCDVLARALGTPVAFVERDDTVAVGDLGEGGFTALTGGLRGADLFQGGGDDLPARGADGRWVATPVVLRTGYEGALVALDAPHEPEEVDRHLSIGVLAVALVLASERSVLEAELRARGELVTVLLSPAADDAVVRRRARASGLDLDTVRSVVVLHADRTGTDAATRLAGRLAAEVRGWTAGTDEVVVVLVPRHDAADIADRIARLSEGATPGPVGLADAPGGVRGLRAALSSAQQTARVLRALGRFAAVSRDVDLGPYRAVLSHSGRLELAGYVDAVAGPILRFDEQRRGDLVRTARTYLDQGRHHARTCAQLHVHANTLYQRLDRLDDLLGGDWREAPRALDVHLALNLHELSRQLAAGGGTTAGGTSIPS
jgi:sugar diacid utilization regulator